LSCGNRNATTTQSVEPSTVSFDAAGQVIAPALPQPLSARQEHLVWNAVNNRALTHVEVDGDLVISANHTGFVRYAGFGVPRPGWKVGAMVDGVAVAQPLRNAALSIPVTSAQQTAEVLLLRVFGQAGTVVVLRFNQVPLAKAILIDGWQTLQVALPSGRVIVGENQLQWQVKTPTRRNAVAGPGFGLAWLRLSSDSTVATAEQNQLALPTWLADRDAVNLKDGASVAWYVTVPEGAHFVADVSPGCKAQVKAAVSDGSFVAGALVGARSRLDLTKYAGQVVRLSVTATECATLTMSHGGITLHGPARQSPAAAPPKYIVLWVMDAMRADRIPAFTPGARAQTPNFDELSKTGAVFRQYYVQGNESQTSHSSVWTSLYPAVHQVRTAGVGGTYLINKKFHILGSELAAAGMKTSGITGNGFVNESGGYTRGFTEFRNMMRERGIINGVLYGQTIVDAALKRLDKLRADPTFLFLGTIDTHGPWIARKPWIDVYSPGPYNGPFKEFGTAKELGFRPGSMGCAIIPPPADVERLRAIYDSAISYSDNQLGRFVAQLKTWGIWDQTMLMVTADHGEELFEDRRCGHGGSLRDTLTRVPLLIHYPALFPGGPVEEGAEGVDLLPTMLAALGKPVFDDAQGASLIDAVNGAQRGWVSPSYASMYEYAHTMRLGRWKIRVPRVGLPILHDLKDAPDELSDFSAAQPFARRMMNDALSVFLASRTHWKKSTWGTVSNLTAVGAAALDTVDSLDAAWR
jgi:arylsulfatase A-like enzyme